MQERMHRRVQQEGCARLHGLAGHQGEIGHVDVEADDAPHGPHQALPGVLGDVLRDVRVVAHLPARMQRSGARMCLLTYWTVQQQPPRP